MKKTIWLILCLMLLLCSCAPKTDGNLQAQNASTENNSSTDTDKSSEASRSETKIISNIYVTHNNEGRYLSDLYEYPLKTAFYSGEWLETTADCLHDFTIKLDGKLFYYHSECGTLQLNGKSKQLNDSDRANVNELLFALFELE